MHWTYGQYLEQPTWLIEALSAKAVGESEYQKVQEELMRQDNGS